MKRSTPAFIVPAGIVRVTMSLQFACRTLTHGAHRRPARVIRDRNGPELKEDP